MQRYIIALIASLSTAACAQVTPSVQWDIETGALNPVPKAISIRRGETVNLEPRFKNHNTNMNLTGAAIEMRYGTNWNLATYYAATGAVQAASTGRVIIGWTDALNPTTSALYYEIRATLSTQILARGYGSLTLLGGMAGVNTGLIARTSLDWATVSQSNGRAVLSNEMGSGATWTGSNWTFAGGTVGGGNVASVFGRTGAVIAVAGDYTAEQVGAVSTGATITINGASSNLADNPTFTITGVSTGGVDAAAVTQIVETVVGVSTQGFVTAAAVTGTLNLASSPSLTNALAGIGWAINWGVNGNPPIPPVSGFPFSLMGLSGDTTLARLADISVSNAFIYAAGFSGDGTRLTGITASQVGALAAGFPVGPTNLPAGTLAWDGGTLRGGTTDVVGAGGGISNVILNGVQFEISDGMATGTVAVSGGDFSTNEAWIAATGTLARALLSDGSVAITNVSPRLQFIDTTGDGGTNAINFSAVSGTPGAFDFNGAFLTNPRDPIGDTDIGSRGYNDARYDARYSLPYVTPAALVTSTNGTATVVSAYSLWGGGSNTPAVFAPDPTWTAAHTVTWQLTVTNAGLGIGYTNSLSWPTNLWSQMTTNLSLTAPGTVYSIIGHKPAHGLWEIRQWP